jgi:spore coat polysaccharide biosynthesis protein SpsF (cytidylyltransferase family)
VIDWDALVLGPLQATFGEPVTFIPMSGDAPFVGSGIFDEAYQQVAIADGQAVTIESPVLGIRVSAFQSSMQALPKQADQVNVRGVNYTIREVQVDSHGGAKLILIESP